jgi:hypothetical protein
MGAGKAVWVGRNNKLSLIFRIDSPVCKYFVMPVKTWAIIAHVFLTWEAFAFLLPMLYDHGQRLPISKKQANSEGVLSLEQPQDITAGC